MKRFAGKKTEKEKSDLMEAEKGIVGWILAVGRWNFLGSEIAEGFKNESSKNIGFLNQKILNSIKNCKPILAKIRYNDTARLF